MTRMDGALPERSTKPPQPAQASTPAEFTAALRALRTWSGLTYRQLESRATAQSDVLPASTMATALGRATLPRERFVDAFTRACGLSEEEIGLWLQVLRRIGADESPPSWGEGGDDQDVSGDASGQAHAPRRWRRAVGLVSAAGIGAVGALLVSSLVRDVSPPAAPPAMPVTGLRMLAVGSWARIHPARTPELCVGEGRDRTGRYETAVAAQQPCAQSIGPQVFLEPVGQDLVQIQWHHHKHGIGCLTVMREGAARNLLEPRDDCADNNRAQQFRIESFGPPAAAHFRIRPIVTGWCLSLRNQDTTVGAEVVQGRCSGAPDQDFLIDLTLPPPTTATGRSHDEAG
ncbi:helix-turn-helix domain-containing protein [Streptomyces sp. enrichment culture]|uniref:helix-turn-helix domain-containing protein n=1 Tax=Streptomyces sp. enrichment culture TaxID=1795815 RepID=UPI003F57DC20